jgi:glucose repression regulatory protein TUP1
MYVRTICFSPDGKFLATGAEDNVIRVILLLPCPARAFVDWVIQIWEIATNRIWHIFDGHQKEIYSLEFSLHGRFVVSGSDDKTVRIWNMSNLSSKVFAIDNVSSAYGDAGVTSVAISPNGQLVAAGSLDTFIRIWDIATGSLVERLRGHKDSVYSVAFTPDGKGLVSGSLDKTLKHWDVSGLISGGVKGQKERMTGAPPSAPGACPEKTTRCTLNFTGHQVGSTRRWCPVCVVLIVLFFFQNYVLSAAVSHDGQWVVSGSKDRYVRFWDSRSAIAQCMLQGHTNSGTFNLNLHRFLL